jgi:hypothetical protein
MQNLPLQIGIINDVSVDYAQGPDSRGSEIECRRRAQASRADEQHFGVEEFALALFPDLRNQEVAAIATPLIWAQ